MVCQECKKRPATVHISKVVQNRSEEYHYCESCARERGDLELVMDPGQALQKMLASFAFGVMPEAVPQLTCGVCGQTYESFRQTGRLGCPSCYREFEQALGPVIRRVQGSERHVGKIPKRKGKHVMAHRRLQELRTQLDRLVAREQYEQAAQVRDQIHALEHELAEGG